MTSTTEDPPPIIESDSFQLLQHGHRDMIQATAFNTYGDRFASSSVDGRIKVYNRNKDGSWVLCDTWAAHNSEILQIQWLPPTIHPHLLASTGIDGKFKLWVEDPTIPLNKGRRFNSRSNTPIWVLPSPSRAPFLSFSIVHKASTRHTYLALINRSAELVIWENDEPENLENWSELDRVNVCDKPARGEEVSFRVQFDPNLEPCYNAIRMGVPRDGLSLIVASMNHASIWRSKEISHSVSLGNTTTKEFYLAAELSGHKGLVRDVAWAPGNVRGYDVVATACKDGYVRVFNVLTPPKSGKSLTSKDYSKYPDKVVVQARSAENGGRPSGIGAGLAGARPGRAGDKERGEGEVVTVVKEVGRLDANRSPVWRVDFDSDGMLLGSTGDDGKLLLWRREPAGTWSKSSELAMTRTVIDA